MLRVAASSSCSRSAFSNASAASCFATCFTDGQTSTPCPVPPHPSQCFSSNSHLKCPFFPHLQHFDYPSTQRVSRSPLRLRLCHSLLSCSSNDSIFRLCRGHDPHRPHYFHSFRHDPRVLRHYECRMVRCSIFLTLGNMRKAFAYRTRKLLPPKIRLFPPAAGLQPHSQRADRQGNKCRALGHQPPDRSHAFPVPCL